MFFDGLALFTLHQILLTRLEKPKPTGMLTSPLKQNQPARPAFHICHMNVKVRNHEVHVRERFGDKFSNKKNKYPKESWQMILNLCSDIDNRIKAANHYRQNRIPAISHHGRY